jgi:hypothetical protein
MTMGRDKESKIPAPGRKAGRKGQGTAGNKQRARDSAKAGGAAAGAAPEPISRAEVAAIIAGVEDFDQKLSSSKKVLENLAAQLGAIVRISFRSTNAADTVLPRLVEMHNQLSSVHHSLEDSFEGLRTRYSQMRDRTSAITRGCSRELEGRRKLFDELGKRIEAAGRDPSKLLQCMKDENRLFGRALDSYNSMLGALSAMRDVEGRINDVFNEFSEAIGRIDGMSRTMGEFISREDTRAFEEELEALRKHREERVERYIR